MKSIDYKDKTFISAFMHELKTPLAIVRSHLESEITNETLSMHLRKKLVLDVEELARLNNLINEMSFLLTAENEVKEKGFEKVSIVELMVDLVEFLEPLAQEKEQQITLFAKENIEFHMNKERFQQLLLNLLTNAMKYTSKKGKIALELSQNIKEIIVEIRDTGIGMSKEEVEQIFKPFYRADKERTNGAGLGLVIALAIAKQHNIEITVESIVGKGSSFFLHIPKEIKCP